MKGKFFALKKEIATLPSYADIAEFYHLSQLQEEAIKNKDYLKAQEYEDSLLTMKSQTIVNLNDIVSTISDIGKN